MSSTPRVIPNVEACIDCGGCEVACMRTWDLPAESDRIGVVTHNEGQGGGRLNAGETAVPMTCFHCAEAPCKDVCPTDAIHRDEEGLIQVDSDKCLGCTYCAWACPFGAPQFPEEGESTGGAGLMDKCTLCKPRLEEGKEPACVSECATDALMYGTSAELSDEIRKNLSEEPFSDDLLTVVFGDE